MADKDKPYSLNLDRLKPGYKGEPPADSPKPVAHVPPQDSTTSDLTEQQRMEAIRDKLRAAIPSITGPAKSKPTSPDTGLDKGEERLFRKKDRGLDMDR